MTVQSTSTPANDCVFVSGKHTGSLPRHRFFATPPLVCWFSTELDALSGIFHSFHLQSLFSVLPNFSYFRLKVASAKCLLDLKHLSQNTSTLPDTRAHKYAFQCYSLIFMFKSRIFSFGKHYFAFKYLTLWPY